MNLILTDLPEYRTKFFPLTLTRPVGALRMGILTIAEKWEKMMKMPASFATIDYLSEKFPCNIAQDNICVNSVILPGAELVGSIKELGKNEGLFFENTWIAARVDLKDFKTCIQKGEFTHLRNTQYTGKLSLIRHVTDLYFKNGDEILNDIAILNHKNENIIDQHTRCYNPEAIYVGRDTIIKSSILDAESGPIYIGNRVSVSPGSVIVGPAAILDDSVLSIGSKIRSNTTIGPYCKVGGEISQVVFQGFSNKSHDGFLGSSVIGEWCNFGAGSNNSNLKNNYSPVKLWDYESGRLSDTGLQYCGLIMGDYSKCGINTMFNTGTVVGICANIFGYGYMPKFIPSFSWGNNDGFTDYQLDKAVDTIKIVMARRNKTFNHKEKDILQHIFEFTAKYRGRI